MTKQISLYMKLKELYWPIVIFRLAIVLFVGAMLLGIALSLAFGSLFVLVPLALAIYTFFFVIICLFAIIAGSLNPRKSQATLSRRNRTVQFCILSIWIWIAFEGNTTLSLNPDFLAGIISVFAVLFFLMYISQLAVDFMFIDDSLPNEVFEDKIARRMFYMPSVFARDFILPLVVLISCIALTYNVSACTAFLVTAAIVDGLDLAARGVFFEGSKPSAYVDNSLEALDLFVEDFIARKRESDPGFLRWIEHMMPNCKKLR